MITRIYSLKAPVFEREVTSVNLKTISGELTILDNHRPLIAPLVAGPIRVTDIKGKEEVIEARGGFVEVQPKGEVKILLS